MKELECAVSMLRQNGLEAEISNSGNLAMGGAAVTKSSGIKVFEHSFSLYFENQAWILLLPGEGQLIRERYPKDLAEAVQMILYEYQQ